MHSTMIKKQEYIVDKEMLPMPRKIWLVVKTITHASIFKGICSERIVSYVFPIKLMFYLGGSPTKQEIK